MACKLAAPATLAAKSLSMKTSTTTLPSACGSSTKWSKGEFFTTRHARGSAESFKREHGSDNCADNPRCKQLLVTPPLCLELAFMP